MRSAAATNKVTLPSQSNASQNTGSAVNASIPVAGLAPWRREALQKVIGFRGLLPGWDGQGSEAPNRTVTQAAIELLQEVPGGVFPPPRIVPVSGGGFHFEWSMGEREVEISIEPDGTLGMLQLEHGVPMTDESQPLSDLPGLFGWLASH